MKQEDRKNQPLLVSSYIIASIFIPMAGSVLNGSNSSIRDYGFIWSSTLGSSAINYAWWLGVNPNGISVFGKDVRSFGLSVRGVI